MTFRILRPEEAKKKTIANMKKFFLKKEIDEKRARVDRKLTQPIQKKINPEPVVIASEEIDMASKETEKPQCSENSIPKNQETLNLEFIEAVKKGEINEVEWLIDEVDVDAGDDRGWTAMMWAAARNKTEIAEILIEYGADVDARDKNSITALMVAAKHGHTNMVKILLEADADVEMMDKDNMTALMWAVKNRHSKTAELLRKSGLEE